MTLEHFIHTIENCFDELEPGKLQAASNFRDFVDWNSINALFIMAAMKETYEVQLDVFELSEVEIVEDLYQLVKSKL